jgi:hypothetical protein
MRVIDQAQWVKWQQESPAEDKARWEISGELSARQANLPQTLVLIGMRRRLLEHHSTLDYVSRLNPGA